MNSVLSTPAFFKFPSKFSIWMIIMKMKNHVLGFVLLMFLKKHSANSALNFFMSLKLHAEIKTYRVKL